MGDPNPKCILDIVETFEVPDMGDPNPKCMYGHLLCWTVLHCLAGLLKPFQMV